MFKKIFHKKIILFVKLKNVKTILDKKKYLKVQYFLLLASDKDIWKRGA